MDIDITIASVSDTSLLDVSDDITIASILPDNSLASASTTITLDSIETITLESV